MVGGRKEIVVMKIKLHWNSVESTISNAKTLQDLINRKHRFSSASNKLGVKAENGFIVKRLYYLNNDK